MPRLWPFLLGLLAAAPGKAGPLADLGPYAAVEAAPVKTSLYVGTASLSAGTFVRSGQGYTAAYSAKVFPFFFLSESGRIRIELPDERLRRLAAGETIEFTGQATRLDGRVRPLSGRVTPLTATTGRIKVRLIVNRSLVLVFNSTYRLAAQSQ